MLRSHYSLSSLFQEGDLSLVVMQPEFMYNYWNMTKPHNCKGMKGIECALMNE